MFEILKRQMRGFGGMITATLKGGLDQSRRFLERVHLFSLAESLGGVESLIEHPAIMTHARVPPENRAALGISEVSDAVVNVVSEETGSVSVAHNGRMIRRLDQSRLRNILMAFYRPRAPRWIPVWFERLSARARPARRGR